MRQAALYIFFASNFIFGFSGCKSDTVTAPQGIGYHHPYAEAGLSVIYLDGVKYPFKDNFDYSEYFAGNDLNREFDYYLKKGFNSFLNIDLNGDSQYVQIYLIDIPPEPGIYQMMDTEISRSAHITFELHDDTLNTTSGAKLISGAIEITKADKITKRLSGVF